MKFIKSQAMQQTNKVAYPSFPAFRSQRPSRTRLVCSAENRGEHEIIVNRRELIQGLVLSSVALVSPKAANAAGKPSQANVGSYLPKAEEGFVAFRPSDSQTPVCVSSSVSFTS